tara:strand:- start:22 stop:231 length:210 start_codon:yes stop_codon:yes gene_type:complete
MGKAKYLFIIIFLLLGCSAKEAKNERYGYWVDGKPWRGTRLDNRGFKKPYRQCVDRINLSNVDCNEKRN